MFVNTIKVNVFNFVYSFLTFECNLLFLEYIVVQNFMSCDN